MLGTTGDDGLLPLAAFAEHCHEVFSTSLFSVHRLVWGTTGLEREFEESCGRPRTNFEAYFNAFREGVTSPAYDPVRAKAPERNRALVIGELDFASPRARRAVAEMFPKLGVVGLDHLRALVCDGPMVVAWLGGFREEPFRARDKRLLDRLVRVARQPLMLERRLRDANLASAGLAVALDLLGAPAFITDERGRTVHANALGAELFNRDRWAVGQAIQRQVAARAPGAREIRAPGVPAHWLVVLSAGEDRLAQRLTLAARTWGLTARQCEVLRHVSTGDGNKSIAVKLDCAEVTIEFHMTALMRKARVESRTELIARFWTL
jgi:DNA-binding CsgD family transcriptional regulator